MSTNYDKHGGYLTFICNECDDEYTIESDDFHETWNSAKEEGWRAHKSGDEWQHSCPTCVKQFSLRNREYGR